MANYNSSNTPWDDYLSKATALVVEEGVTSVGNYAFYNGTKITTVTLPEGITSIGERSFYDCGSITNLNLPDSITYIGHLAFYNCEDLADIHLPSSLITIDDDAFQNCDSIVSVDLPEGVTSIGKQAFYNCDNLTSVYLPDSLTFIGGSAFLGCSKLVQIAIPEGITSIENRMFDGCSVLTNVTLPSSLQTIGTQAFNGCTSLAAIDIPDSVTVIGNNAFNDCASLTEIVIPDGVTVLGNGVLRGCTGITDIVLHGGITEIGQYALKESSIGTIHYLGDASAWNQIKISTSSGTLADAEIHYCTYEAAVEPTCTETGREDAWVCDQCGVVRGSREEISALGHTEVIDKAVPATCTETGLTKGKHCSVCDEILVVQKEIPAGHNIVGGVCTRCGKIYLPVSGTWGNNLTWEIDTSGTLTISGTGEMLHYTDPNGWQDPSNPQIDGYPWHKHNNNITAVVVEDGVASLAEIAFHGLKKLTSVTLPDSLVAIGDAAFIYCTVLESIVIPKNVSSLGKEVLIGSTNFKEITFTGNTPAFDAAAFGGVTATAYYPANNPTWTVAVMQDYGGDITWEAYGTETQPGPVIVTQPTDAKAALGQPYKVEVKAEGESLKYHWYFRNAGSDTWYKSGVKDNTYDDVMTKARAGREIYCVITDAFGNTVTTETAKLIRVPKAELKILTQPVSDEAAMGEDFCVTVEAQGEDLKYQWYFKNAGTDKWYKSGVRDNTYDDVMTKARAGREIYCVITDAFGNTVTTEITKLIRVPKAELKILT